MDEGLLERVGEVVLGAEEDDAALADWWGLVGCFLRGRMEDTGQGEVLEEVIGVGCVEDVVHDVGLLVLAADDRGHLDVLELVECTGGLDGLSFARFEIAGAVLHMAVHGESCWRHLEVCGVQLKRNDRKFESTYSPSISTLQRMYSPLSACLPHHTCRKCCHV